MAAIQFVTAQIRQKWCIAQLMQPFLSHSSYAMNCRLRRQENREKLEHQVRIDFFIGWIIVVFLWASRIVPSLMCWFGTQYPNWPICLKGNLKGQTKIRTLIIEICSRHFQELRSSGKNAICRFSTPCAFFSNVDLWPL